MESPFLFNGREEVLFLGLATLQVVLEGQRNVPGECERYDLSPQYRPDMHPKKGDSFKSHWCRIGDTFLFLVSCNTAYLFYCNRLRDKSVSSVSKQLQFFIISNTLFSVNFL